MSIWFQKLSLAELNRQSENTILEVLGIEITEIGEDYLKATMPVDHRTHQPAGLLHGGASVTLAESLGSIGGYLTLDPQRQRCVGVDINANHIRAARTGFVEGTAHPIHIGRSTQVWEIKINNQSGQLICISRITLAILDIASEQLL